MAMMKQLRDSTKVIMIIVAVSFVGLMVFEWGMELSGSTSRGASGSELGSVNGAPISVEQYQRQYQILYEVAQRQDPDGELTPEDLERIEQQAWESVVEITLLQQEAGRRGIRVTDREIVEFIRNNPPQDLINLPAFQTDGQFDIQKYQQALGDPALADTWAEYERTLRERLPVQLLQEQIGSGVPVTDLELMERYRERNERARIAYVHLDPERLVPADRVTIDDEEIRRWYESHKERFRRDESATILWVAFEARVTAADSARVKSLADSIAGLAAEPDRDFAQLAERWSEDRTSADAGGDLGWIDPASMHPAFSAALAGLEPGQVTQPFLTPFGWHVVKLEERSEEDGAPRARVRQILLRVEPSREELQRAREEAQAFAREASASAEAFRAEVGRRGIEAESPPTFEKGAVVPGIGVAPAVAEFVFANPAGSVSGAIEQDHSFYVVRVEARYPAGTIALDRVTDAIRRELLHEKRLAAIRAMTPEIVAEATARGLEGVAARWGLEVRTTGWFTRENNIPAIGSATPVAGAAFGLAQGQTAGPVETERGLYLIRLLEKRTADLQAFEQARAGLRDEVRAEKTRILLRAWFEALKEKAEIEDNRAELLGGP